MSGAAGRDEAEWTFQGVRTFSSPPNRTSAARRPSVRPFAAPPAPAPGQTEAAKRRFIYAQFIYRKIAHFLLSRQFCWDRRCGRVVKALDLSSTVRLHAWVRTPPPLHAMFSFPACRASLLHSVFFLRLCVMAERGEGKRGTRRRRVKC